jgi:predicted regulator of Ras-like GTPase activity (Roadblock/LC7/MglB family)
MNHDKHIPGARKSTSLKEILYEMHTRGKFQVSVLTSVDGLPIAAAPADYDSDLTAAIVALLQRVSNDARSGLKMAEVDELTIRDRNHIRLVCRYLVIGRERLILAAMVPPGRPYRRVTNRAVRQIEQLLA